MVKFFSLFLLSCLSGALLLSAGALIPLSLLMPHVPLALFVPVVAAAVVASGLIFYLARWEHQRELAREAS